MFTTSLTKRNVKLIPAIPEVVAETDIEGGVMKITPLEGFLINEVLQIRGLGKTFQRLF